MRTKILYRAIDLYYSDQEQIFIGMNQDSIDYQITEFERWLGRNHPAGISCIYEAIILEES